MATLVKQRIQTQNLPQNQYPLAYFLDSNAIPIYPSSQVERYKRRKTWLYWGKPWALFVQCLEKCLGPLGCGSLLALAASSVITIGLGLAYSDGYDAPSWVWKLAVTFLIVTFVSTSASIVVIEFSDIHYTVREWNEAIPYKSTLPQHLKPTVLAIKKQFPESVLSEDRLYENQEVIDPFYWISLDHEKYCIGWSEETFTA